MTPRSVALALTGVAAATTRPLGGEVHEVGLADGDVVVVKRHPDAAGAAAEAAGLAWLAVPGGPPVPRVRGTSGRWLGVDRVPVGRPTVEAAEEFGRALAVLHLAGAEAFGVPPPGGPVEATIGAAPMRNVAADSWAPWFLEHRIAPYTRSAVDAGVLTSAEAALVERVEVAAPEEPPARLHGDLWRGNVLWGTRAWLIDPAAHGGHRETDLAMLALFGCPHLDRVMGGYADVAPLGAGWRARAPLHRLFPLLVHAVLFGRGYAEQALEAVRALP
ncbi:fructosamine kinase family protein [Actinosynnema sp. NPDC020468]|uniref:fructosamine kinase family protein n=1 Tax=Actinosynnema sp. NPDC020468 TaxID=3154488 RepID=UPI0033FBECB5